MHRLAYCLAVALALLLFAAERCCAVETVVFRPAGETEVQQVAGRVLAKDATGALYLQRNDGAVYLLTGDEVISRKHDDSPFEPLDADALSEQLLSELPDGFSVYKTPHYIVAHRTSRDFAKWTASMLERLHRAFTNYWSRAGFDIAEPEFPLIVIVYADAKEYARAAEEDLGQSPGGVIGYYSLKTNRVSMFDLTGQENLRGGGRRRSSLKEINQILTTPAAVPLVSTVVHEATHQIAFNCGLQTRFSDLPLWFVEGMAEYFEAPDLSSNRGWRGIGKVNYPRLQTFRENVGQWGAGGLATLITTDLRLRDPRTAADAYADAWALTYYLIQRRPKQYNAYLKVLAAKPALVTGTPEQRLVEFQQHFGDIEKVQREFLEAMARVR